LTVSTKLCYYQNTIADDEQACVAKILGEKLKNKINLNLRKWASLNRLV
jgi:hypothetical protein